MTPGLARLLRPASIAVFGGAAAAEVVRQSQALGFSGSIWPVHPHQHTIAGLPAYRNVADLPGAPDASFLGVNRHVTIDVMAQLAESGAGGAVVHAAGFSEVGQAGADLQHRLHRAAAGMPFLGPNCYGFINYLDRVLLWPDQHGGMPVPRGVGIVTQSGNIGLNLTMQARALPIGYMITLGNQASVGLSAAMEALLDDPRVTAIGLHIEAIDDPRRFAAAAARAARQKLPVIALKTGKSSAGAALALSHTASLGSADAVADAFLRHCGVVRVHTLPILLETLKLLHQHGPLPGRDIASMSCSGGEAALIADAATGRNLRFRRLAPDQTAAIGKTLGDLVTISNPLDYHTFSWKNPAALTATFTAMMQASFDLSLLILDYPRSDRCNDQDWASVAGAFTAAATQTGARAAILATLPESMPPEHAAALFAAGITPLCGLEDALAAIEAAADAAEYASRPAQPDRENPRPRHGQGRTVAEWQGKRMLAEFGVAIPEFALATTPHAASACATQLGFPVALKATGASVAHKTELGAVRLGLANAGQVSSAAAELLPMTGTVLIERMVTGSIAEMLVGVVADPIFGPCLVVGSGGVLVDLVADSVHLLIPATRAEIAHAIAGLKIARLCAGYRGRPPGDLQAAIDAVLAIQEFAIAHAATLIELDVNPLMICEAGQGAVAADVLIHFTQEIPA